MKKYRPQKDSGNRFFRRLFPNSALHRKKETDLFAQDPTQYACGNLSVRLANLFHRWWPWSKRDSLIRQVHACQEDVKALATAHAAMSQELKQTLELLAGYVRQCSLHCSHYDYVPGEAPDDLPCLSEGEPDDSSVIPSGPTTPPTTKVILQHAGTGKHVSGNHGHA